MKLNVANINSLHTSTIGACGYCEQQTQNAKWVSSGFECEKMDVNIYNELINRGWRRSGTYYYKPDIKQCCCKPYTIRVLATKYNFEYKNGLIKSNKKWEKFLKNEEQDKEDQKENDQQQQIQQQNGKINENHFETENESQNQNQQIDQFKEFSELDNEAKIIFGQILSELFNKLQTDNFSNFIQILLINDAQMEKIKHLFHKTKIQAHNIREIKLKGFSHRSFLIQSLLGPLKDFYGQKEESFIKSVEKNLETYFLQLVDNIIQNNQDYLQKYQVNIKIINNMLNFKYFKHEQFYKEAIFKQNYQEVNNIQKQNEKFEQIKSIPKSKKKYEVKFIPAFFDEQNPVCQESFNLYKEYMQQIHNKVKISKQSYKNFLCVQALQTEKKTVEIENGLAKEITFGCYHINQYIDDVLMMVSVVDILPQGLSQVYNYYKPSLKKYYIGIVSSLNDIKFIKEQNKFFPEFQYYYTGFYIQNNKKMKYKADYTPCQLLCPYSYQWVNFDSTIKALIDQNLPQNSLIENNKQLEGSLIIEDMNFIQVNVSEFVKQNIKLFIGGSFVKFNSIKQHYLLYFENLLTKFVQILGKQCSQKFIFGEV